MKKQTKAELCPDVRTSISANKDILRDFERAINATSKSRSKILFERSCKPTVASLKWNIRDMRSKLKNIREL